MDRERPTWDDYYMVEAEWASSRSLDPRTQHGAVLVTADYEPISQGYNSYPKNTIHEDMPKEPPGKYLVTIHAEQNAILFSNQELDGAILYVTGKPCARCWSLIIQKGIKRVVYGNTHSYMYDAVEAAAVKSLLASHPEIEVVEYQGDIAAWLEWRAQAVRSRNV